MGHGVLAESADDLGHPRPLGATKHPESPSAAWRVARLGSGGRAALRPAHQAVGRVLPVREELAGLFPQRGLRCGSTVAVRGSTSLLLALLAAATAGGSWAAVVGMPDLGLLAAAELGVAVHRLALVPRPRGELASVIASLLDGLDLVAVATEGLPRGHRGAELAHRLSARARHRGAVIVGFGPWPGADVELSCLGTTWSGLGAGHGYLSERELVLSVSGRGAAARAMRAHLVLSNEPNPTANRAANRTVSTDVSARQSGADHRAEAG